MFVPTNVILLYLIMLLVVIWLLVLFCSIIKYNYSSSLLIWRKSWFYFSDLFNADVIELGDHEQLKNAIENAIDGGV